MGLLDKLTRLFKSGKRGKKNLPVNTVNNTNSETTIIEFKPGFTENNKYKIEVDEAYGNEKKYIVTRVMQPNEASQCAIHQVTIWAKSVSPGVYKCSAQANNSKPLEYNKHINISNPEIVEGWLDAIFYELDYQNQKSNIQQQNGLTPEQLAAATQKANAIILKRQKKNSNIQQQNGLTPEQLAAATQKANAIILERQKKNSNIQPQNGLTPEQLAAATQKANAIILERQKKNSNMQPQNGLTPEQLAAATQKANAIILERQKKNSNMQPQNGLTSEQLVAATEGTNNYLIEQQDSVQESPEEVQHSMRR